MQVPFGPLAPDAGSDTPGVMMVADGVLPLQMGYAPFPGPSVSSTATALPGAPRGIISLQKADGSWLVFAGTEDAIYMKESDDTWTAIDTGLLLTQGDDWSFCRFGTKLLYTNTTQGLRAYDIESAGAAVAIASAGSPRWIFECGNILFGLDCLDSTGARNNRLIRSSKMGVHTAWTGAGTDYQSIEGGGALIWGGRISDNSALILQQRSAKLLPVGNAGGGAQWGLMSILEEFGSTGAKSCVAFDGMVFWQSTDGWRAFSSKEGLGQIGAGAIDQWFLAKVDQSDMSLTQGTIDLFRKNVLWRYKGDNYVSASVYGDIIGYNWQWKRWFTLTINSAYLAYVADPGVTWDTYDGTWDDAVETWDSRLLQGGQPVFGMINSDLKYASFGGANLAATLETSVGNGPFSTLINWATPIDDATAGTTHLGVKDQLSDTTDFDVTGVAKVASGRVPLRGRGLNIGFRRVIPASATWTFAKGVDHIGAARGGPR